MKWSAPAKPSTCLRMPATSGPSHMKLATATARCAAWTKIRSMSGLTRIWSDAMLPALVASHCIAAWVMMVTSGNAAIFSSKPCWMSRV